MDTQSTPEKPVAPTQMPVAKEKTRSRPAVVILSVLLIAALAGLAFAGYSWFKSQQQVTDLQNELSLTKDALAAANAPHIAEAAGEQEAAVSDKGQRSSAERAARLQFCEVVDNPCDTSTIAVTKIKLADLSKTPYTPGFAIVSVSEQGTGAGTKYYLKSTYGENWVVMYEGQNLLPQDIADKFGVPADFIGQR